MDPREINPPPPPTPTRVRRPERVSGQTKKGERRGRRRRRPAESEPEQGGVESPDGGERPNGKGRQVDVVA